MPLFQLLRWKRDSGTYNKREEGEGMERGAVGAKRETALNDGEMRGKKKR